jgi:aromatic-L-amino-acid/L-tryptophan decarboxylase
MLTILPGAAQLGLICPSVWSTVLVVVSEQGVIEINGVGTSSGSERTAALSLGQTDRLKAARLLTMLLDECERSTESRAIVPEPDRHLLAELLSEPFPEVGTGVDRLFAEIRSIVMPNSTNGAHPRFLAYVHGGPNGIAPYAEAIAAAINQNCTLWQTSAAANVIERALVRWFAGLYGFPEEGGGLILDGGSMATLTAVAAAAHDCRVDFREHGLQSGPQPLVLYTSAEAHRSVEKAAAILGLGVRNVRKIGTDRAHRMRVDLLEQSIETDRAEGRQPFCVVATAGTVMSGAIDPLDAIAALCRRQGLWLHVDGAYGGLFVLSDGMRDSLLSCGQADSLSLDPHKLLFAPLEAGCLLVRDTEKLRRAFAFSAPYIPAERDPLMLDFMDYGPQLSRSFKAFKVWCALRTFGVSAFRSAINNALELADYLSDRIEAEPTLELMTPTTLTAVCFSVRNADLAAHRSIVRTLQREGTAFLGPAELDGRSGIRACVTNYRTTRTDIDRIVSRLRELTTRPEPAVDASSQAAA